MMEQTPKRKEPDPKTRLINQSFVVNVATFLEIGYLCKYIYLFKKNLSENCMLVVGVTVMARHKTPED